MIKGAVFALALLACSLLLPLRTSFGAVGYNYQLYPGNGLGDAIGNGALGLSNNTTTVYANLIKGGGSFIDNLVIFIDSAPGGFTSTTPFSDKDNPLEVAISGVKGSRSTATFAPGFGADYAIALGINSGTAIYKLVNDDTGPHLELVRSGLNFVYTDSPNHGTYSFQFDWADIGLPDLKTNFFKFETSYISSNGYRWLDSFEGLTGKEGYNSVTFTNYDTYGVQPVPENTNAGLAVFGGMAVTVAIVGRVRRRLRKNPGG